MRTITTEQVEIDLSPLLKRVGRLIPGKNVELNLIGTYKHKYNEDSNIFKKFTLSLLQEVYGDVARYSQNDIYKFIPKKTYDNIVISFVNSIDILILNKIKPYPLNIVFVKFLVKTDEEIRALFDISYLKDEEAKPKN